MIDAGDEPMSKRRPCPSAVAASTAHDLRAGITAAFGAAALAGLVALAVTGRLPAGTGATPPPAADPVAVTAPGEAPS